MRAAPVTFALSLLVAGRYQRRPTLPFVPGNTIAGDIVEIGGRADRGLAVGQRVLASLEYGGLAEEACAHAANVYPIPDAMSYAEAATLNTSYNSALAALTWPRLLNIQGGETLLVTGAAGGVGIAALEMAKALGARVIASASSEAKRACLRQRGADVVLSADPASLKSAVMRVTEGVGVDCALDPVGGVIFGEALRCLKPGGRILPIGFASGTIPTIPANLVLVKNISIVGLYMGYYKIDERNRFEPDIRAIFTRLGEMHGRGEIKPIVAASYPLEHVADAFRTVLDRETIGHVVLTSGT
ncbi:MULTISPECIES: NADPH:quinone oxidoreductase family protein [unclassified Chelatococcus]|uniref:NADPH:quinone oxidoreductase family protein n=1 Tax=unclassified Chelatococcus TaxID=2638111 RepID=UPI001BCD6A83|nr:MULTISPECIES: NADPH:quinone oxidoreductase family protein [unclassified Chelatococcus]MBS7699957.1 NADPH:quinone oxidoreductase family protein [Chelatococcus sp. YT9]MBX3558618.1 NADPH:quinone oxidoreductase family protein [Chelatococcus sp.]